MNIYEGDFLHRETDKGNSEYTIIERYMSDHGLLCQLASFSWESTELAAQDYVDYGASVIQTQGGDIVAEVYGNRSGYGIIPTEEVVAQLMAQMFLALKDRNIPIPQYAATEIVNGHKSPPKLGGTIYPVNQ